MHRLNVLEVQRTIMQKKQRKYELFEKVIEICNKRIQSAAEQEHMRTFLVIPEFLLGLPIYNLNECIEYVMNSYKKNGFFVRYYFPKMLYVSWDLDEIDTEKKLKLETVQLQRPQTLLTSRITTNRNGKLSLSL